MTGLLQPLLLMKNNVRPRLMDLPMAGEVGIIKKNIAALRLHLLSLFQKLKVPVIAVLVSGALKASLQKISKNLIGNRQQPSSRQYKINYANFSTGASLLIKRQSSAPAQR
jgi:hypothetical protein